MCAALGRGRHDGVYDGRAPRDHEGFLRLERLHIHREHALVQRAVDGVGHLLELGEDGGGDLASARAVDTTPATTHGALTQQQGAEEKVHTLWAERFFNMCRGPTLGPHASCSCCCNLSAAAVHAVRSWPR